MMRPLTMFPNEVPTLQRIPGKEVFLVCQILKRLSNQKNENFPKIGYIATFCAFFSHNRTHFLYIMGNSHEGKVHCDLVLSCVAESPVSAVVLDLTGSRLGLYASPHPVLQYLIRCQPFLCLLPVSDQPVVDLDCPVPRAFEAAAPERASSASLCPVTGCL